MAPPVCPRDKEEASPREDVKAQSSDEEDPYAPPDEVALEPPTFDFDFGASTIPALEVLVAG